MSHYARLLGVAAGMDEAAADDLLHAAPLHDVGKIGIPDRILHKRGKLDAGEWAVMQTHARIGGDIIGEHAPGGMLALAREIAVSHHEKWDGSGYPLGLARDRIPLAARIVAVADVFDALTSARPYKHAWPVADAVGYLQQQKGRHFDGELVDLFVQQLPAIDAIGRRWAEQATPLALA